MCFCARLSLYSALDSNLSHVRANSSCCNIQLVPDIRPGTYAGEAAGSMSARHDAINLTSSKIRHRGETRSAQSFVNRSSYFDTDFLNIRSIFSLIASIAVEFACADDNA
jgi:hypothetical protein